MALEFYSMPWYLLSTSCQKEIMSGIHNVQNGPTFTIGPFAELNFETASDVRIYFTKYYSENNFKTISLFLLL